MTAYRGATGPRAMLGQAPAPAAGRRRGPRRAPSAMGHAGAPGRHQAGTVDQARHQHGQRLVGSTSSSRPARRAPSIKPGASTSSTPGAMDHAGAPGHQASRPAPSGTPGASARPAGRAPSATGHAGAPAPAPAPAPGRAPSIKPGAIDQAGRQHQQHTGRHGSCWGARPPGHQASRPAPSGTPGASARPARRAPSATGHAGAPAPAPGRAPWIRPGASTGSAWWAAPAAGRRMDQAGRHRLRHQLGQPR